MGWMAKEKGIGNYIASTVEIEGILKFRDAIRFDGVVIGEVKAAGTLITGESSVITGNVWVENLVASGTINGNVFATGEVILNSAAKVNGDLNYTSLSIDGGAVHEGSNHKLTSEEKDSLIKMASTFFIGSEAAAQAPEKLKSEAKAAKKSVKDLLETKTELEHKDHHHRDHHKDE